MSAPTEFAAWSDKLATWLSCLKETDRWVKPVPALGGDDAQARLNHLMQVRMLFAPDDWAANVPLQTGNRWGGTLAGVTHPRFPLVSDAVTQLLTSIDQQIGELLDTTPARHPYLVRSADFTTTDWTVLPIRTTTGETVPHVLGFQRHLPADHELRRVIPGVDWFRFESSSLGDGLALILGPPRVSFHGPMRPRPWYLHSEVIRLTRIMRDPQKEAEAEAARRSREEERRERERVWASPEAALERQMEGLLRKRGL